MFAQIRLAFSSTTGARIVATRNLQLKVKANSRPVKALEGNLLTVQNGERTSVSKRVAELDNELPIALGVSKAILDNVVFCHQDESLWPLSEPGALKKKFDEIFEALRYTKAIENIKQLRKKQNEELAKFKIIEENAKTDKDRADKTRKRTQELSREQEILRQEQQELREEAEKVGKKAQAAWQNVARFTEIVESLRMARRNREFHQEQVRDLGQDLHELPDSDDSLRADLTQFERRVQVQESWRVEQTRRYEQVQQLVKETREQHGSKRMEAGRHEQAKAAHKAKLEQRNDAIRKAANGHNIRGYDMELDDMQIYEFMDRISRLSKEQNARVDELRRENASEVQKIQDVLDQLRERRTTLNESRRAAKERVAGTDRKIKAAHAELQKLSSDEASRANLMATIEELHTKLHKAKQALASSDSEKQVREANRALQELDEEAAILNKTLIDNSKRAGERARLEHLQKEAKDRQRSLDTMKGAHGGRIGELVGSNWSESSLEADYQALLEAKKAGVVHTQLERDAIARELEQVEYRLKTARADLKKKQAEADASSIHLREALQGSPEEYPSALAQLEVDRDQSKANVEGFTYMQDYFSKAIEVAESDHPACRLCQRAFKDAEAARKFAERLMKKNSEAELKEYRQQLELDEMELRKLRDVGPSYETWKRITNKEIPVFKEEISKHEDTRKGVLKLLEEQDSNVRVAEDAKRVAEGLSKPIAIIAKCRTELQDFQGQIEELMQKQGGGEEFVSLEDLQEKISATTAMAREQRQKVAKLQADEQSQRTLVNSLEMDLSSTKVKLAQADHELEKKASIVSQIEELKSSNEEQTDIIATIDVELEGLGPRWSEETARRDELKQRNEAHEAELQRKATDLMDSQRELQRLNTDVQRYSEEGGPAQLLKCQRDIQSLEQQLTTLEGELKDVTVEINKIREELSSQDRKKRLISDNLKYREAQRKLAVVEAEAQRLGEQNAEADQQRHRKDAERLEKEHQELRAQVASKVERMKVKDDQIVQLCQDWDTDFKDAAPKYRKAHIQVETTRAAVEDLRRYGDALDKAIMRYHTLKMEEINRIVEELWKRTYQGTDVDTILIRSDNETEKGNRSYNYRVCMVKQDAEMDMRGRCSAGQKVLASIIIRLALAECFGVNCGLIALDEPTTNLDRENIKSLAESLHHIIRQRQQQKNFQLIVITHDEDFLRAIQPVAFCDHYWRVSRNEQQKSIIERQNIAAVM